MISKAVEYRIKEEFSPEHHEEVMRLLPSGNYSMGIDDYRIQNAILNLSDGNIDRFRRCIEMANVDLRDILMGSENLLLGKAVRRKIRGEPERKKSSAYTAILKVVRYIIIFSILLFIAFIAFLNIKGFIFTN
jgi:hypothetical protein